MSTQTDTPADPGSPAPSRRRWSRWAVAGGVALVIVVVVVAGWVLTRDDDDANQADTSQRIAATQAACQQWLDSNSASGSSAPDAGWCGAMSSWMNDQVANGSMMGSMMWGSPQAMVNACQDWSTTTGESSARWCDQMVTWMSQHMGTWDDGQDWDDHMGDGHWDNGMMGN